MALSDNIRALRIRNGMTLEQLGEKCEQTKQQVSKYERNVMKPQPETLVLIAQALGTTAENLVFGKVDDDGTDTV